MLSWLSLKHKAQHALPGLIISQTQAFDEDGGIVKDQPEGVIDRNAFMVVDPRPRFQVAASGKSRVLPFG